MYMNRMLEIGKAENGFVVECRVSFKPKAEKKKADIIVDFPGSSEKQYVAKTLDEVTDLVQRLLPLLEDEFTSEDEFNSAFSEAAKK